MTYVLEKKRRYKKTKKTKPCADEDRDCIPKIAGTYHEVGRSRKNSSLNASEKA